MKSLLRGKLHTSIDYIFSEHAIARASERFRGVTFEELKIIAEHSKVARKKLKKKIGERCPKSYPIHMEGAFKNRYYLYNTRKNIVFVVGDGNRIITLFELREIEDE